MPADLANDTLLLTCASGRQCNNLIPFLLPKWKHLRLTATSESSRQQLLQKYGRKEQSHIEVVKADLAQPDDCKRICEGVTAIYHIGPPFHPHETQIGYNMIDAAVSSHATHFVFSSVLHPSLRKLINHDSKRYVEEYLIESGLQYTILQPSHFMDLFPIEKLLSEKEPVYPARWNPDTAFSHTSLYDLGEAAAKVLEQREPHFYATYQMVSSASPMGYKKVCAIASGVIGKEIRINTTPFQAYVDGDVAAMSGIKGDKQTRVGILKMLLYYNNSGGLMGSNNAMKWILGREPEGWKEWVERKQRELEGS